MKKFFICTGLFSAVILFASCGTAQGLMTTLADLDGSWAIVELNGVAVVPAANQDAPAISFDAASGAVSGTAGCNRITGSFDTTAKRGKIDLGQLATTRRMCTDMTTEENILKTLRLVKGYQKTAEGMALTNGKRPILVLRRAAN